MKVALAVLCIVLAGCGAPASETVQTCDDETCQVTVDPGEDTLAIDGVVVDRAIAPVAGAKVALKHLDGQELAAVTTNEAGAFRFEGVSADFYSIRASAPEYTAATIQVQVRPDLPAVRIMLEPDPTPAPYHVTLDFDGLMGCSWRVPAGWLQLCSLLGGIVGDPFEDNSAVSFWDSLVAEGTHPDFLQTEMHWKSTQPIGEALTMMIDANVEGSYYGNSLATVEGPSPLTYAIDNATAVAQGIGAPGGDGTTRGIGIQVWSGADAYPIGMTYQQDFELFLTATYGFVPPDDWTFLEDGAP